MPKYLIYKEDQTIYFLMEAIKNTTLGYDKIHPNNYPLRIIKKNTK